MPAASLHGPQEVQPREPTRPRPPAAGPDQAAPAAPFAGLLSRALEANAPGATAPSRTGASAKEQPSASGRLLAAPGGAAEGPQPVAVAPDAAGPHPAADLALTPTATATAVEPGGAQTPQAARTNGLAPTAAGPGEAQTPQAAQADGPALAAAGPGDAGPLPVVHGAAAGAVTGTTNGTVAPRAATARERAEETPVPPSVGVVSAATSRSASAPATAGSVPSPVGPAATGGADSSPSGRSPGASPGTPVPNGGAPGTAARVIQTPDPSRPPGEAAVPPEQEVEAAGAAPTSRRAATRESTASSPEADPAQDAIPAAEPVLPLLAVFPVPAPPAEPPATGGGPRPRAIGPDGATPSTIAAAVAGPPAPVPPGTETPAEEPGAASAPRAMRAADVPPPAASAPPADSASSSAVLAPATDSASPPAASAPAVDSASPQPVAQPVHAAPARPAEGFHPAGHTAHLPAAEQVASVLVQVGGGPAGGGGQRMVVRLDPAELGKVEVRVERAEGGPAQVSLTVERPETLLLLLRDQPGLHRALDQAGVPAEGRALQFQLAPAAPDAPSADRGATPGWGGAADGGKGDGTWHGQGHGGQPGGRHRGHAPADTVAAGHGTYRAWRDAGLDITA